MTTRPRLTITTTQRLALNTTLSAALNMLKADAAGLTRYLEEAASDNPSLIVTPAERPPADWLPRWTGAFAPAPAETAAAATPGLIAHVMADSGQRIKTATARAIALHIIEALEPSGWLGRPLADIARDAGCSLAAAEDVLLILQQGEPRGLFARSLAECLRLQAVEAGADDAVMTVMLDHLDLLATGDTAALARRARVPETAILARLRIIRTFDPKPGVAFQQGAAPVREPDLVARKVDGTWHVALNRSALPGVALSPDRQAPGRAEARALVAMIAERNSTLLRVGQEVLWRQAAALDDGLRATVPMRMADIAAATGLAESTISRVVAGTAVDTPRGTWWLRHLFSRDMGDGISAVALRDRVSALIAAEDPARPLSDDALATALSEGPAQIARRTVAKYRGLLRIPPAHARRVTPRRKTAPKG
jgi:RNA polymerase sigma-54 factor